MPSSAQKGPYCKSRHVDAALAATLLTNRCVQPARLFLPLK